MHMFINKFKEQPSSVRKRCLHICPRKRLSVPRAFRNTQCPRTNIRTCILAKWKILRLLPFNNIFETRRTKYVYHNNWYGLLSVFSSATTAKSSLKLNSVVKHGLTRVAKYLKDNELDGLYFAIYFYYSNSLVV